MYKQRYNKWKITVRHTTFNNNVYEFQLYKNPKVYKKNKNKRMLYDRFVECLSLSLS